ncbi:hypothetical protein JTE90_016120 [Oedothorax gibbosus]|uniref:CUB domain-containing protein n=1 Tax=Oedothorax gibbosus TaxID=931172 RepID=A0AAV6U5V0_9ARAC|nr:hypothetical protein JTE90_016120 [Oedothorax gibbosus]
MKKFCGYLRPPPTVTFMGRQMRMEFRSDDSLNYRGFSAEYSFIDIAPPPTTPPTTVTRSPREVLNDEVSLAKKKLVDWFMGLRRKGTLTKKWGHELPRIAVALFLADQENLQSGNRTMYEMNYELTIQLLSKLQGGGHLKRRDLSLYIPALMVACVDPRNFHGRDLVAELRSDIESNNGTGSPFELLVLCNAGDAMSDRDVQRMATIFDSQHRPFWTDNQALATLALACASAQPGVTVDERTLLDMAQELKKRQFRNGTVDNIKTTALVIQALAATGSLEREFDFWAAIRALLAAQRDDGSVGSFLDSYYVLPVLSRSTLLNVTANHCKRPETSESEALNELQDSRGSRVSVTCSVVIGTDVDLKRTWTLKVLANSSLYSIMEMVQKLDSRQKVEYNVIDGKPFVSSVMGIQDDAETGFYWFTFLRKHNAEDSILVEDSPVDVKIEANQELILWYKSGQWNKP